MIEKGAFYAKSLDLTYIFKAPARNIYGKLKIEDLAMHISKPELTKDRFP